MNDVEAVRRFLRVDGVGWEEDVLIGRKRADAGLGYYLSGHGDRSLSVLAKFFQHPLGLALGDVEVLRKHHGKLAIHTAVHDDLGYLRHGLSYFIEVDGLLLFQVLGVPKHVMHHHPLLKEVIQSKLGLLVELIHPGIDEPAKEGGNHARSGGVVGLHGSSHDMSAPNGVHAHCHSTADEFVGQAHFLVGSSVPREHFARGSQRAVLLEVVRFALPEAIPHIPIALAAVKPLAQIGLGFAINLTKVINVGLFRRIQ